MTFSTTDTDLGLVLPAVISDRIADHFFVPTSVTRASQGPSLDPDEEVSTFRLCRTKRLTAASSRSALRPEPAAFVALLVVAVAASVWQAVRATRAQWRAGLRQRPESRGADATPLAEARK